MPATKSARKSAGGKRPVAKKQPTASKPKGRTPAKATPGKRKGGRRSDYHPDYCDEARKLCMLFGATDAQLAEYFEVSEVTINAWKKAHPEFLKSAREGKVVADANVAYSLYQRAVGITVKEEKEVIGKDGQTATLKTTRQLPGDVQAQRFFLKNRQPSKWRENVDISSQGEAIFSININERLPDEVCD